MEYNLFEFAITINISFLKSTKIESTYKMYKFLEQRLDYNLLQMNAKFTETYSLNDCHYWLVVFLYIEHTVLFFYSDIGQRWPNSHLQLVVGLYQNLFASLADQQLFI
jgi:hypothetical protein